MNGPTHVVTEAHQQFSFTRRATLLAGGQLVVGALLAARMAWLAIVENEHYQLLSESNRVNVSLVPPQRGLILDRNGLEIANNRTDFRVDIIPDLLRDKDKVLALLQRVLGLSADDTARIALDLKHAAGFQPVQVANNLPWERFAAVSVRLPELPGVAPTRGYSRSYPAGAAVAHLTGYVGAANAEQYRKDRDPLLITPGYKIGKDGLERALEGRLRGTPGAKRIEVTARGKLVRELETRPETPGTAQRLTIDLPLQHYVARRLGTNSGSAVVLDCLNGDILAMASVPAYDPNSFSDGISHFEWDMLSSNDHVPLMNKVLQGLYPPGSTVKPMNALALLKAGIDPHATVNCSGVLRVGSGVFHCHSRRGHGAVNMRRGVAQSCDIYFFEMARRIGYDAIAPVARTLGLGEKFDLPFSTQRYGTVPDSAWKLQKYKTPWTVADSLNASIGQGYVLANPLQLAVMAGRLASGRALQPRLLMDGPPARAPLLDIDPAHLATVHDAMFAVVNDGGTGGASRLQIPGIALAAKTGTAQVRRITLAERRSGVLKNGALPFKLRDHALFVCFAPADKPRYAAGIALEHNGHTVRSLDTPLIGRDIMTFLFDQDRAMQALAAVEPSWGGDIPTRMAAQSAAYRASLNAPAPVSAATELSATAATDAPAVEAATDAANATAEVLARDTASGNGVAEIGSTEIAP